LGPRASCAGSVDDRDRVGSEPLFLFRSQEATEEIGVDSLERPISKERLDVAAEDRAVVAEGGPSLEPRWRFGPILRFTRRPFAYHLPYQTSWPDASRRTNSEPLP
jgi:hypothetical protein